MDGMTKEQFEQSTTPMCFCVSIDPTSGEKNWEYIDGWSSTWMRELIKRDFPERFFFSILNRAAAAARSKELFGLDLTEKSL